MHLLKAIFTGIVAGSSLMGAAASPPTLTDIDQFSFVNMQNDTTISVSYTSSGCFHYESGIMLFTPETLSYQGKSKSVDFQDMAGLDAYFRGLAKKQGQAGGCTSSTNMTLTLNKDNQVIGKMLLKDDFCFRGDGMLAPNALKYKLFEKEKDEKLSLIEK